MSNDKSNVVILGVTGGIACGKSEAGRILGENGFSVCDADHVAHGLMKKGTAVFKQVVDHFGVGILAENGEISRRQLGSIVFNDPARLQMLNQLVHPAVRDQLEQWIAGKRSAGVKAAVLIPLLFESGMQDLDWDAILCVSSSKTDVIRRLNRRGMTHSEAEQRISSQMPAAEKEALADYVVPNRGTLGEMETALRKIVAVIEGAKGKYE